MKSQTLVIDTVRNWLPNSRSPEWEKQSLEGFDVITVLSDPEYPGMEKIQGKVIWNELGKIDDVDNAVRNQLINTVARKFAKATGTKFTGVKHIDQMTYLDFKGETINNVEGFDWLDIELEVEIFV